MSLNKHYKPGCLLRAKLSWTTSTSFSYGDFKPFLSVVDALPGDFVVCLKQYNDTGWAWFYGLHQPTARIVLLCIESFDMIVP